MYRCDLISSFLVDQPATYASHTEKRSCRRSETRSEASRTGEARASEAESDSREASAAAAFHSALATRRGTRTVAPLGSEPRSDEDEPRKRSDEEQFASSNDAKERGEEREARA